jgi:hypothetical protein
VKRGWRRAVGGMKTRLEVNAVAGNKRNTRAAVDDNVGSRQRVVIRVAGAAVADGLVGHLGVDQKEGRRNGAGPSGRSTAMVLMRGLNSYLIATVTFCCELSCCPTVNTRGCGPESTSRGTRALIWSTLHGWYGAAPV